MHWMAPPPYKDKEEQEYQQLVADGTVELIKSELRRLGYQGEFKVPTYAELVASGMIKAAECKLTSRDMVMPGWDRTNR